MSDTELKPCPFCGNSAHISSHAYGKIYIKCDVCPASIAGRTRKYGKNRIINIWNTRKGDYK